VNEKTRLKVQLAATTKAMDLPLTDEGNISLSKSHVTKTVHSFYND